MTARQGDTVKVHYTGTLDNGEVFDSSAERDPLEFTLGEGQLIPGFEEAVIGMESGEVRTVRIPAERAYGPHRAEMAVQVSRDHFPDGVQPEVGQMLQVNQENGEQVIVTVTDIEGDAVTLDANHPLAGKDLTFEIRLMEIG